MKTVFASVLLLVILSTLSFGQLSSTDFNPNILVHSQGLPQEFLLFVPDTATQILFNPARAKDYSGSFIYTTYAADFKRNNYLPLNSTINLYYPYYGSVYGPDLIYTSDLIYPPERIAFPYLITLPILSANGNSETYGAGKNPTVAVATLFNALNSKWLFLFTNGMANQNGTSSSGSSLDSPDPYNYTNRISYNYSSELETRERLTSFRLSKIISTEKGNRSFGVFALFNTSLNNSDGTNTNGSLNISGTSPYQYFHSSVNSYTNKLNEDNSKYVLGFEITTSSEQIDYIARVSYQKSTYNNKNTSISNRQYSDSTYYGSTSTPTSSSTKSYSINSYDNFSQSEPYTLSFENYYQQKSSIFLLDGNIFVSAKVNYTNGEGKAGGNSFSDYRTYVNGTWTTNPVTGNQTEGKFDNKSWGFTFTPGFILKKTFSDLFLLTGLKLETGYNKLNYAQTDYNTNAPALLKSTLTVKSFYFSVPVYIHYSPEEWITVWGGMNYSYGYTKRLEDVSGNSTSYYSSSSSPQNYSVSSKNDNSFFQSMKSTFLGLELKHSSGLRVQISFDEDIASFRDWNMSAGYHF